MGIKACGYEDHFRLVLFKGGEQISLKQLFIFFIALSGQYRRVQGEGGLMRDELLGYYERELSFMRRMGAEFAETYPKIAGRLALEPDKCDDPHVERLIEAFAFLAGRVRLKIDDEYPEVTESFLNVLYPNLLAPVPSMSIVQFVLDPGQVNLQTGHTVTGAADDPQ